MSSVLDSELLEHSDSVIVIIILSFLLPLPFSPPPSTPSPFSPPSFFFFFFNVLYLPLFPFVTFLPLNILVSDSIQAFYLFGWESGSYPQSLQFHSKSLEVTEVINMIHVTKEL